MNWSPGAIDVAAGRSLIEFSLSYVNCNLSYDTRFDA